MKPSLSPIALAHTRNWLCPKYNCQLNTPKDNKILYYTINCHKTTKKYQTDILQEHRKSNRQQLDIYVHDSPREATLSQYKSIRWTAYIHFYAYTIWVYIHMLHNMPQSIIRVHVCYTYLHIQACIYIHIYNIYAYSLVVERRLRAHPWGLGPSAGPVGAWDQYIRSTIQYMFLSI